MATLYDLAMQYLNQSLPKTFKYDRTNQPGTNPPVTVPPQDPNAPVKRILPVQGGDGAYNPYNPDPNSISNKNYSPYDYRQAAEKSLIGSGDSQFDINKYGTGFRSETEAQKFMDMYPDYYRGKKSPLEGIMSMMPGQQILKGLASKLPVNRRAIFENELSGQGIMVNDIGQIVASPGNINTAENIMAGYNANKITADTFQKRRDMINAKMKDPEQKAAKLKALDEAEAKILGTAKTRTDAVFDMKSLAKDPDYKSTKQLIDLGIQAADDDSEDEMLDLDYTNPNIYNTKNIFTQTAPTYTDPDPVVDVQQTLDNIEKAKIRDNKGFDLGVTPGDSGFIGLDKDMDVSPFEYDDAGTYDPGSSYNAGSGNYNAGRAAENAQRAAIRDAAKTGMTVNEAKASVGMPANLGDTGGGDNQSNAGKIVCTMMNQSYGFGSFRNKIWMKFHKNLSPEYQKGYHKLFLPLVRIAKTNKVVKKILEHIAVHSTIDMRQATRGKMHLLGRIYRKILLPLCYFVGKHG